MDLMLFALHDTFMMCTFFIKLTQLDPSGKSENENPFSKLEIILVFFAISTFVDREQFA